MAGIAAEAEDKSLRFESQMGSRKQTENVQLWTLNKATPLNLPISATNQELSNQMFMADISIKLPQILCLMIRVEY